MGGQVVVAAPGRAAADRLPAVDGPARPAHRRAAGAGAAAGASWLVVTGPRVQLRAGDHPPLLHGRPGAGDRRPGRASGRHGVALRAPAGHALVAADRARGHGRRDGDLGRRAAGPLAGVAAVAARALVLVARSRRPPASAAAGDADRGTAGRAPRAAVAGVGARRRPRRARSPTRSTRRRPRTPAASRPRARRSPAASARRGRAGSAGGVPGRWRLPARRLQAAPDRAARQALRRRARRRAGRAARHRRRRTAPSSTCWSRTRRRRGPQRRSARTAPPASSWPAAGR